MSARRRGYRELQADAACGTVTCPRCHEVFVPLEDGRAALRRLPRLPADFPARTPEQRAARIAALRPRLERLRDELRGRVGESTFSLWLAPVHLVDASGDTLYATAPDEVAPWIKDRFGAVLEEAASALAGRPVKVVVAAIGGAA